MDIFEVDPELIREVLNKHDPIGLLRMGAPLDEYDLEAKGIAAYLVAEDNMTATDYAILAHFVFVRYFDYDDEGKVIRPSIAGPVDEYRKIGEDLYVIFS